MFARRPLLLLLIVFTIFLPFAKAQEPIDLRQAEDSLRILMQAVIDEKDIAKKFVSNQLFSDYLQSVLEKNEAFDYPFDSLTHIGKLNSADKLLRVFTWNIPLQSGMQTYFGFIQTRINGNVAVFRLNDHREQFETPQTEISNPDKWFGALYYYIHQNTCEGVTYYTLLGVDFNNLFSRKRVIEVLSLDRNGMPIFGTPIISVRNHLISRIIFEYSAQASMSLLYDTAKDMIVFDHLSPMRGDFAGNYQFYGPDFTFDGLQFKNGKWEYIPNIDVRNPQREQSPLPLAPPVENPEPGFLYKPNTTPKDLDASRVE